jgi:hypothetical protein
VSAVAVQTNRDASVGIHDEPCNRCVMDVEPEPSLWWKLKCATNHVADDVAMADQERVGVVFLTCVGSVDILAKTSFNSCSFLEELVGFGVPVVNSRN